MSLSQRAVPAAKKVSFAKRAKFLISVMYNYVLGREHHHAIIENEVDGDQILGNIYLGAMPMEKVFGKSTNHHHSIKKKAKKSARPLGLVVGVVEDFELEPKSTYLLKPIEPNVWRDQFGINFHKVNIPDFSTTVEYEDILNAVQAISRTRQAGNSVFLHCKAGRSRSVLVLMCYLMTEYKNPKTGQALDFEQAYNRIKKRRSHIDFKKDHKRETVERFVSMYAAKKADAERKRAERITTARDSRTMSIAIPQRKATLVQSPQDRHIYRESPLGTWHAREKQDPKVQTPPPLFSFGRSVIDLFSKSPFSEKKKSQSVSVKRSLLHH